MRHYEGTLPDDQVVILESTGLVFVQQIEESDSGYLIYDGEKRVNSRRWALRPGEYVIRYGTAPAEQDPTRRVDTVWLDAGVIRDKACYWYTSKACRGKWPETATAWIEDAEAGAVVAGAYWGK